MGVGTADGRYELVLWGRNLAGKRMNTLVFDSVFQPGSWHTFVNAPRALGVTLKARLLQAPARADDIAAIAAPAYFSVSLRVAAMACSSSGETDHISRLARHLDRIAAEP